MKPPTDNQGTNPFETHAVTSPPPSSTAFVPLTQALPTLDEWVAWFRDAEIPVLANTAEALEAMRAREDDVDANLIGEMVADDPLMTLKILAHAAVNRTARRVTDVETVTAAVVLQGISPFFNAFGAQPTVEDRLAGDDDALDGVREVLRRGHRAAKFAFSFAVHRMDLDAAVIHGAALLHDFAEMLLWCHAPALALRIRRAQQADPTLRSTAAQREVLNIELGDLQHALMKNWALPDLLIRITDDKHAHHPSVKSVVLAIRLARHSAEGWDNPALPDDLAEVSTLLNLSPESALAFVQAADE